MKAKIPKINPYVKKKLNDFCVDQAIEKVFHIYVLYCEKGRSTYETFEDYLLEILKDYYGVEKFELRYNKLVKILNKN